MKNDTILVSFRIEEKNSHSFVQTRQTDSTILLICNVYLYIFFILVSSRSITTVEFAVVHVRFLSVHTRTFHHSQCVHTYRHSRGPTPSDTQSVRVSVCLVIRNYARKTYSNMTELSTFNPRMVTLIYSTL